MAETLKLACIQMNSGPEINENLKAADAFIREAAAQGAQLIATPENTCQIRMPISAKLDSAPYEAEHPALPLFSALAEELNVWILVGSLAIKISEDRLANRSYMFSPEGKIAAQYDKIHLFDVDLSTGETHRESDVIAAGDKAVVAQTPWGGVGLSICYDLRFAYLYRDLAKNGARILAVPAAFTVPTGQAHWKTLLRARAIETGSFVIAPAQTGQHEGGRKTWGHSLIIDPWGAVIAEAGEKPGIITADIKLEDVEKVRQAIPALKHDRIYGF